MSHPQPLLPLTSPIDLPSLATSFQSQPGQPVCQTCKAAGSCRFTPTIHRRAARVWLCPAKHNLHHACRHACSRTRPAARATSICMTATHPRTHFCLLGRPIRRCGELATKRASHEILLLTVCMYRCMHVCMYLFRGVQCGLAHALESITFALVCCLLLAACYEK
jgi:hypothetical protein